MKVYYVLLAAPPPPTPFPLELEEESPSCYDEDVATSEPGISLPSCDWAVTKTSSYAAVWSHAGGSGSGSKNES